MFVDMDIVEYILVGAVLGFAAWLGSIILLILIDVIFIAFDKPKAMSSFFNRIKEKWRS